MARAQERLVEELAQHAGHVNPARSFYFWNRTRREIALVPFGLLQGLTVHTPYLYRPLWSFLDSLPYELVADHAFHTDTIGSAYPELFKIPFENKGAVRPQGRWRRAVFALDFFRWTVARSAPKLKRLRVARRTASLLADMEPWWSPIMVLYLTALLRSTVRRR